MFRELPRWFCPPGRKSPASSRIAGPKRRIPGRWHVIPSIQHSAEFLGEPDEEAPWPPDVAEPVNVFIIDDLAHELHAASPEPFERPVEVVHGEHNAEIAQGIDRGV